MNFWRKLNVKANILWYQKIVARQFGAFGNNVNIFKPLKIDGHANIFLGNGVSINYRTWLAAMPINGHSSCRLSIGDGTVIGNFNHIYATGNICIGVKVLTADKVYISDNLHHYEDIHIAIMDQPIKQVNEVYIGDGSWIGENAVIIGCSIGKNCIVAANAVVTRDVPDYCVVAGVPAKIIKRYNITTKQWEVPDDRGTSL